MLPAGDYARTLLQQEEQGDTGHGDDGADDFLERDALPVDYGVREDDEHWGKGHEGGCDVGK